MKFNQLIIGSVLGTCTLLAGCNSVDSTFNSIWPGNRAAVVSQNNENILSQLIVLNKAEVASADLALAKSSNKTVRQYAIFIKAEHTRNLQKTLSLSRKTGIKPMMNITAQNLQNHGNQELANLRTLNNANFDRTFINASVQDHQTALNLLDQDIAQSTNAQLTAFLKETRIHVAHHLERARAIQNALG